MGNKRLSPEIVFGVLDRCVEQLVSGKVLTREDLTKTAVDMGLKSTTWRPERLEFGVRTRFKTTQQQEARVVVVGKLRVITHPQIPLDETNFHEVRALHQAKVKMARKKQPLNSSI